MTVIAGTGTIALRMMITKYNGAFSGSTHTINSIAYLRVFIENSKKKVIVLPFIFKNKSVQATGLKGTLQVQFN